MNEGEVVTLLGRNGAGKTTTMKSIMGLVPRREGSVMFKGTETIGAEDFRPAFLLVGLISASSALFFWSLPPDAGAAMANRTPIAAPDASDQRIG